MTHLQIFSFEENEVRTIENNEAAWFNLSDVCKILDIKNPSDTKSRLKQDGVVTTEVIDKIGRMQRATFINEPNLYKVIFQSRKEEAEKFQDWVYEEVLPQIRRTGKYEAPKSPMEMLELQFNALKETNTRVETVEKDVRYLKDEVKMDGGEYNYINRRVNIKVAEAVDLFALADEREIKNILYKDINKGIHDITGVKTRTQVKQKHFNDLLEFIRRWEPSTASLMKAKQMTLNFNDENEGVM